jgi:Tol biopolymer transport system component
MMKRTRLTLSVLLALTAMLSTVGCGVGSSTPGVTNPVFTKMVFDSSRSVSPATNLFIMGVDGSNLTPVALVNNGVYQPSISADAKTIAFNYQGNVWVQNAATSVQTQLTTDQQTYALRFSPNGKKIVFNHYDSVASTEEVWIMNVDGTSKTNLTTTFPSGMTSCWTGVFSADSAKIVMSCYGNSTYGLYTIKADGTGLATVLTQSNFMDTPAFSPDGTKIVFVNFGLTGSSSYGVVSVNLDGTNQVVLALGSWESEVLNSSVYYTFYDTTLNMDRIYKCDLDGSNATPVTDGTAEDYLALSTD